MIRAQFRTWNTRKRTYVAVAAVAVIITVLVAPAVAAYIFSPDPDAGPPPMEGAREVAGLETSWGQVAQIWIAKAQDGRSCEIFQIGDERQGFNTDGAVVCATPAPTRLPVQLGVQWFADGQGGYGVIASGHVDSSTVKDLVVQSTGGGTSPVAVTADGYFLIELPQSAKPNSLSRDDPSPVIVALGADGQEVARIELKNFARRT